MASPVIDTSSQGWIRVEYRDAYASATGAEVAAAMAAPAVMISVRNPSAATVAGAGAVHARGLLNTGATVSSMPMWAVEQLGIALDKESLQPAFGASGGLEAYSVWASIEAQMDGIWMDVGIVEALVPDTGPSRNPDSRVPFLLGRDGFFDKCSACFDEAEKVAWLRRTGAPAAGAAG